MPSDHQKNTTSAAEQRLAKSGSLQSGQCSSEFKKLEYADSISNYKLNPSIDQPPPYAMANNSNVNNDTSLLNMQPQSTNTNTSDEPAAGQRQPNTIADPTYAHHGIEPEERRVSCLHDCLLFMCSSNKCDSSFECTGPCTCTCTVCTCPVAVSLTLPVVILVILCFLFWVWLSHDSQKSP
jgi:hypothetical protein